MERYLGLMRLLTEPGRFRIARILDEADGELCICELVDVLQMPQYAVSRSARALARGGILTERRQGKLVYYRTVENPFVEGILRLFRSIPPDDDQSRVDFDRLRWRTDIRDGDRCVVTYRKKEEPMATEEKERVLFICVHNSARSQIAEEYLRKIGGDIFEVESAGLTPGALNLRVVTALAEEGIDISHKTPQSVFDLYRSGRTYSYVIAVCSRQAEENCPLFPGPVRRINWPFPDPATFTGSSAEIDQKVRELRNAIRESVMQFVTDYRKEHASAESA